MNPNFEDFEIDLTQVSELTLAPVPPGIYNARIDDAEFRTSQNNNPVLSVAFEVETDEGRRKVFTNFVLNNDIGLARLKKLLSVVAPELLTSFRPAEAAAELIGREARIRIRHRRGRDGELRAEVQDVLPKELEF